mmetsp:Transcript_114185/g.333824  ORF Transcript_114185/g.333824 Transcript_114185/m.333824 type:complete len:227 (+) Transcript_114185:82-762(+)
MPAPPSAWGELTLHTDSSEAPSPAASHEGVTNEHERRKREDGAHTRVAWPRMVAVAAEVKGNPRQQLVGAGKAAHFRDREGCRVRRDGCADRVRSEAGHVRVPDDGGQGEVVVVVAHAHSRLGAHAKLAHEVLGGHVLPARRWVDVCGAEVAGCSQRGWQALGDGLQVRRGLGRGLGEADPEAGGVAVGIALPAVLLHASVEVPQLARSLSWWHTSLGSRPSGSME